jgi:shikimate kinase
MKTNIALTGFMGSGKTAVALSLAQHLGYKYISTDAFIEGNYGFDIPYIFTHEGETRFRELEIQAIKRLSLEKYTIIDCGGGVPLNTINIDRLRENAVIFYLFASPEKIIERLSNKPGVRPLLQGQDADGVKRLLARREPFYKAAADETVDTTRLDVAATVNMVIALLKKNEDFNFKK